MSAYGTKKALGDFYQQMSFPAVYSEFYSEHHYPLSYSADQPMIETKLPMGGDIQAQYHEQKRRDANQMVYAGLEANRIAEYKYLNGHQGYFGLPPPVRSQRIYANPSNGNQSDIYSARPSPFESLHGGVLRTAEGQSYGKRKLKARAQQIGNIQAAKAAFLTGEVMAQQPSPIITETMVEQGIPSEMSVSKMNMINIIDEIDAAIESGSFGALDARRLNEMLPLLFREAVSMTRQELEDVIQSLDGMVYELRMAYIADEPAVDKDMKQETELRNEGYLNLTYEVITRALEYTKMMYKIANQSPKDRRDASKNFVKALGFTTLTRGKQPTLRKALTKAEEKRRTAQAEQVEEDALDMFEMEKEMYPSMYKKMSPAERRMSFEYYIKKAKRTYAGEPSRAIYFPSPLEPRAAPKKAAAKKGKKQPQPKFDVGARDEFANRSGAYLGEEEPSDNSLLVKNPMRAADVERARLPEEEAEAPQPEFAKMKRKYNIKIGKKKKSMGSQSAEALI